VCLARAVEDNVVALTHFNEAVRWLKTQGIGGDGRSPLKLRLGDARWFHARMASGSSGQVLGLAERQVVDYGYGRREVTRADLTVVRGLPTPLFQSVVVHEIGHAWLTVHQVDLPLRDEEGFCQMLSHRYFRDSVDPAASGYAARIAKNPDPVYGDGYRAIAALVDRVGFDRVVRSLQVDRRLPNQI
jgi:hypothetical protein